MSAIRQTLGGVELDLQVVPRSAKEGIGPLHGERIKLRVGAPPVEGAANEAVRALLAELLGVPRGEVRIARGETGRKKTVHVAGDPTALGRRVRQLLGEAE